MDKHNTIIIVYLFESTIYGILPLLPSYRYPLDLRKVELFKNPQPAAPVFSTSRRYADSCRLTVTHDQLREGANEQLYGGWPMILSGLKTWLETGQLLTTPGSLLYGG